MKKKWTLFIAFILLFSMLLTACGGTEETEEPVDDGGEEVVEETTDDGEEATDDSGEKILHTNNSSEPGALDPALAQGTHESWILDHIFEGLMKYDEDGNVIGGMAEDEFEVSEDGLTYTFHIKDGMKWSNGDPVTANDFEFSWKRILDPTLAADYAFQLYYIEGAEELNTIERPGTYYVKDEEGNDTEEVDYVVEYTDADLEGLDVEGLDEDGINDLVFEKWIEEAKANVKVSALDEQTLEVTLAQPTPYFDQLTAFYSYFPVNQAVVEANPDWAKDADDFVSNGPFALTLWSHDAKIEVRKNEHYYNADEIALDGIDWDILEDINTAYQNYDGGQYDILVDPPQTVVAEFSANEVEDLIIGKQVGTYYFNLNNLEPPFDNANIRKALSYALDRTIICDKVAQGGQIPATGLVPYGLEDENGDDFREANGNLFSDDPELAKEYLEKGLEETGLTVEDLDGLVLLYNTSESHKKIAQVVQQMWEETLGFTIQLENVDFNVKLDREKEHDFDISRAGWVGDYADPMTMMDLFVTNGPFNDCGYANSEYDELIYTAKGSADQDVRMESMKEAEQILMEDMPIVPVYFYTQPYLVKPNVEGIYKPILNYPVMIYADFAE